LIVLNNSNLLKLLNKIKMDFEQKRQTPNFAIELPNDELSVATKVK
jgi:hypothetical protein